MSDTDNEQIQEAPEAPVVPQNWERLNEVYEALLRIRDEICSEEHVPERFTRTLAGELADADTDAIRRAALTVHRLMLWKRYPSAASESYFVSAVPVPQSLRA